MDTDFQAKNWEVLTLVLMVAKDSQIDLTSMYDQCYMCRLHGRFLPDLNVISI
jgi:hypothetical protein